MRLEMQGKPTACLGKRQVLNHRWLAAVMQVEGHSAVDRPHLPPTAQNTHTTHSQPARTMPHLHLRHRAVLRAAGAHCWWQCQAFHTCQVDARFL